MVHTAFVGTYTRNGGGLYSFDTDASAEPTFEQRSRVDLSNPSFVAVDRKRSRLYSVIETPEGGLASYHIDPDGSLTPLDRRESGASGPCHCSVHPSGQYVFVAHYNGGAVSMLPVDNNGQLGAPSIVELTGSGPDPQRQAESHPHSAVVTPNGRYVYVPDLGSDLISVHKVDTERGEIPQVGTTTTRPGSGPRHLEFHPSKSVLYLLNELNATVNSYTYDEDTGEMESLGTAPTLPASYDGKNQTSEIRVHPSGRCAYASNRSHDSIAVFDVNDDGTLRFRKAVSTGGRWPRHFTFGPDATQLFVGNRRSNEIVRMEIDERTGGLRRGVHLVDVPEPSCIQILSRSDQDG